MDNNLEIIFNTISQQDKGLTSKITPSEWNFIVNVLSKQSNHNAKVLKNLKILFQKIMDSGSIEQKQIDELKEEIEIIKDAFLGKADLVDGKVPLSQLPDVSSSLKGLMVFETMDEAENSDLENGDYAFIVK